MRKSFFDPSPLERIKTNMQTIVMMANIVLRYFRKPWKGLKAIAVLALRQLAPAASVAGGLTLSVML